MKNTEYEVKFVDLIAFQELLEKDNKFYEISKNNLKVIFTRYSMDENGYHNGYESYTARWKLFNKNDLEIVGIPTSIFPKVIIPKAFHIIEIKGAERNHKYYCRPDAEFVWQEINHWLDSNLPDLPEAEFNREEHSWECGYFKEYIDSVKSST